MLYITVKSSAPANVRRSCAAKQAARNRRITRRMDAHKTRTAVYTPAVIVPPVSPAVRIAAMLITDDVTGRFTRSSAAAAVRLAPVAPAGYTTKVDGQYKYIPAEGPTALKPVNDAPAYSRPRAVAGPAAAVCIPSNHAGIEAAASVPAPEYNTSTAAKTAIQARQYGNVQTLATRATISAVKLAIAPRARFVNVATVKESTISIDDIEYTAETLESASGDNRGSYTTTLKNALASLQIYAHSDTAAYPENADAADLLSVATVTILEAARRVGVDAETWASGYNTDGLPFTRVIDVTRGGHNQQAGRIITGYRAVFATVTAAVNTAIRGEKTRQDSKVSIDPVSMGSDTTAPAHYDAPDVYSMDAVAAIELSDVIADTIRANAKNADVAAVEIHICAMLSAGYKQVEIAAAMGRTQSYIAKHIAKIRAALASML